MAASSALASATAAATVFSQQHPQLLSTVLRRAPFVVFSKRAPSTLPNYNVDQDFLYYFFSDHLRALGGLDPAFLTSTGNRRNAKTDFPMDYRRYFQDDAEVCLDYVFPKVQCSTEPWKTPARHTIVETRKTCITIVEQEGESTTDENDKDNNNPPHEDDNNSTKSKATTSSEKYMLGCFGPHDDMELGLTSFVATSLPPALPALSHIPQSWYTHAFAQLPLAVRLYRVRDLFTGTWQPVAHNALAMQDFAVESTHGALHQIQPMLQDQCCPYNAFFFGGSNYRLWMWRVNGNANSDNDTTTTEENDILAVAFRNKREVMPQLIEDCFTSELPTFDFVQKQYGGSMFKKDL